MKPDKRREGSVSRSGLGRNTTEISCEPRVNDSDLAEKYITQGSSGDTCKVGMSVFESHNRQTEPQMNQGSCDPAANISSEVPSTSSSCDFPRDPHHVRPDSRSAQGGLEGHGRRAAYRLDQDGAPFSVAGDHRRGPQSLLQEAESRATLGVSGVASSAEASQDQEGHAPEVCERQAQVDQRGQHDDRPTGDPCSPQDLRDCKAASFGSARIRETRLQELSHCSGGGAGILLLDQQDRSRRPERLRPAAAQVQSMAGDVQQGGDDSRGQECHQDQGAGSGDEASQEGGHGGRPRQLLIPEFDKSRVQDGGRAQDDGRLEGEVDKMKEEQKPRKKGTKPREPESDTSSYQMVMQTEED